MKLTALLAVALLSVGGAALAQSDLYSPTGSRVGRPPPAKAPDTGGLSDADRTRAMVNQFADCMVRSDRRRTGLFLAAKADAPEAEELMKRLVSNQCVYTGTLIMQPSLLRGSIFRSLYLREFPGASPRLGEQEIDFASYVADPKSADGNRYLVLMDFAGCVVRADPANTAAYVAAEPGSGAENAALAALQPKLGPCFPAGAEVTINRSVLSASLAEAVYRESEAGRPSQTAQREAAE